MSAFSNFNKLCYEEALHGERHGEKGNIYSKQKHGGEHVTAHDRKQVGILTKLFIIIILASLSFSEGRASEVKPEVISRVPTAGNVIALTFDACSTKSPSHYDRRTTAVLVQLNVPATIFVGGIWARDESDHLTYLASQAQFEIGNHTWNHPHLRQLDENAIKKEILLTQEEIFKWTQKRPKYFRPPYGEYDSKTVRVAAQLGLVTIEYDLPSGDPDIHATKEKLIDWVSSRARGGSIVVMHINKRGWHTADALPGIVKVLREKGFEFVTVGELIKRGRLSQ